MRDHRTLSSQAEGEIAALRAEGVTLTDEDIVRINALCWEIETPSHRMELARGRPVHVGGVWLWPLTVAASNWFDAVGSRMSDPEYALAYAMANGRGDIETANAFDVTKFGCKLKCTRQELQIALAEVIAQDEKDDVPQDKGDTVPSHGELAMMMHLLHGGDIDMWERRVSIGYIFDMLHTAAVQKQAGENPGILRARENLALAVAIEEIRKRGSESDGD